MLPPTATRNDPTADLLDFCGDGNYLLTLLFFLPSFFGLLYNDRMRKPDLRKCFYEDPRKTALFLGAEALIIGIYLAIDLLTKEFVYGPIAAGEPDIVLIKGVLKFTAVENTGASFGIFSDSTTALLIVAVVTAAALTLLWVFSVKERNRFFRAALILMIAGAIGNIVDRAAFGYVRDFIYFELIDFAVFNLADSGLCVGCGCMIVYIIFFYRPDKKKDASEVVGKDGDAEA